MTDLDIERIDVAFADFAALAGRHVDPPGPDIVVTTYRHRRRMRTVAATAVAVALVAPVAGYAVWHGQRGAPGPLSTATPAPDPSGSAQPDPPTAACTVSAMRLPAGLGDYNQLEWMGVDPTGHYAVGVFAWSGPTGSGKPAANDSRIVRWHDGDPSILPLPDVRLSVTAINSSGTVIGGGTDLGRPGWQYRDDRFSPLPTVAGSVATPKAIDAAGNIVGSLADRYGAQTQARWPADRPGTVVPLTGGGVGGADYFWDTTGALHALPVPDGYVAEGESDFQSGWAVGTVARGNLGYPALWNTTTGTVTVILSGSALLTAVNASGVAVGFLTSESGRRALVYRDGAIDLLPALPANGNWEAAAGVSPDGSTIIGSSGNRPVSWHC